MTASKYVVLFAMVALGTLVTHADALNNRPVIGLFAQPSPTSEKPHRQYIAASYVKWIESGGGRVVPMDYYIKAADADKLLDQLSAVVFPGGGSVMPAEARYVYNRIVERNTKGKFFPLWGTCNGFEWIAQAHSHDEILTAYNSYNVSYPIYWAKDAASSRFYRAATPDMRAILANETLSVTMNNHHWGVSTEDFNTHMSKDFYLVSTNKDEDGKPFVSTFEHKKYPVYGVQWHPEKNNFEWSVTAPSGRPYETIRHGSEAVRVSQFTANMLVDEARQNPNTFKDWKYEQSVLIYNYPKVRTEGSFVETYYFDHFIV